MAFPGHCPANTSTTPAPPHAQTSPKAGPHGPARSARLMAAHVNAHAGGHVSA